MDKQDIMTNCENARKIALTLEAPKLQQTDTLAKARSSQLNHVCTIKLAEALIKYGHLTRIHASSWHDAHKEKIDLSQSCRL